MGYCTFEKKEVEIKNAKNKMGTEGAVIGGPAVLAASLSSR